MRYVVIVTEVRDPVTNAYSRLLGELSRILREWHHGGFYEADDLFGVFLFGDPFASVAFVLV